MLFEDIRQFNRISYFGIGTVVVLFVIGFYKTDQMDAKIDANRLVDKEEKKALEAKMDANMKLTDAKMDRNFLINSLMSLAGVFIPLLIKQLNP